MRETAVICTIVAKNYLAQARVLCVSFLQHHPDGKCYVLIVDAIDGYLDPEDEMFEVVRLADLAIPNVESLCFKYTVLELSTAVKPFLLRHLLANDDVERILYLDPDILVTAPLHDLFTQLDRQPILLTPHLDQDYPQDGKFPNDRSILLSGIFNLGFLGVRDSSESTDLLLWLEGKLLDHCVHDQANGYFVDQRFFDLAFSVFPFVGIERGVGYNVAYWNLHSRFLSGSEGNWRVNAERLRFYHFSNYSIEQEGLVSGYCTRYDLTTRQDLGPLFGYYRAMLLHYGYATTTEWDYSYDKFANGYPISNVARREYQRWLRSNAPMADPFRSEEVLQLARAVDSRPRRRDGLARFPSAFRKRAGRLLSYFRNSSIA